MKFGWDVLLDSQRREFVWNYFTDDAFDMICSVLVCSNGWRLEVCHIKRVDYG